MKHTKTATKKRVPGEPGLVKSEGESVLLSEETTIYAIDVSGSMDELLSRKAEKAGLLNLNDKKIEAVRTALSAMLNARQSYTSADKLGVVTFGGNVRDYATTVIAPSPMSTKHFDTLGSIHADGGTPMFQGLKKSAEELKDAEGLVRILLITDGEPNSGYEKKDVLELINEMHQDYGFVIDTLGIGIPGQTSSYDETFLKTAAKLGGGEFYPVEDIDALIKRLVEQVRERQLYIGSGIKLLQAVN